MQSLSLSSSLSKTHPMYKRKFNNRKNDSNAIVVECIVSTSATTTNTATATTGAVLPDRARSGRIHDPNNFSSATTATATAKATGFLSQEINVDIEEEEDVNVHHVNVNVSHDYMSLYEETMVLEEKNEPPSQLRRKEQPIKQQPLKQQFNSNSKSLIVVPLTILSSNANSNTNDDIIVPAAAASIAAVMAVVDVDTNSSRPRARSVSVATVALSNDSKALSFAMKARLRAKKSYQRKIIRLKELPIEIQDQKRLEYNAGRKTKAEEKRDFEIGLFISQSDDKSTWICRGCSKTYRSELGLIGHIKRTCDVYKQWKPKAQQKRELEIDFLKQKSMDGTMPWECRGCCKKYKSELELIGHIKRNCIVYKKWKSIIENNNTATANVAASSTMTSAVQQTQQPQPQQQQQQQSVRSNTNRSSLYSTATATTAIRNDDNNNDGGGGGCNMMYNWQQPEQTLQQQQQQQSKNLNSNHQGFYDDGVEDEIMMTTPSSPNHRVSGMPSLRTTILPSVVLSSRSLPLEPRPFNDCGGLSTIDTPPTAATVANNTINKNNSIMNNNNHLLNHHSFNRIKNNYDNTLSSSSFPLTTLMMAGEGSDGFSGTNHLNHNHNHNQRIIGGSNIRDDTAISFHGIAGRRAAAAAGGGIIGEDGDVGVGVLSSLSERQLHHNIRCKYSLHQIQMQIQHQMEQRRLDRHRILVLLQQQQHQQQQQQQQQH